MRRRPLIGALLGLALLALPAAAPARGGVSSPPTGPDSEARDLTGTVINVADGQPLSAARVQLAGLDRAAITDAMGRFTLAGLPAAADTDTLLISHPDHAALTIALADLPRPVVIRLTPAAFALEPMTVRADPASGTALAGERPLALDAADLQRRLDTTLAAVLDGEVGVARRSMGPGAERPVLRGLGGYRLPVLSDDTHTGDLSATAPDHAMVVEPLLVESVEVLRGPAALQFSGGTLAGVVNVRSGNLLEQPPDRASVQLAGQVASASDAAAGQLGLAAPLGPLGLKVDLSGRRAGDLRTPDGRLVNTGQHIWSGSTGLSYSGPRGFAGVAVSRHESDYGIPGGFMGGHPGGVDIELERTRVETRAALRPDGGAWRRLEVQAAYSRYEHRELESSGICGVAFGQLTHQGLARVQPRRLGPLREPVLGLAFERRDLAMACLSFLPPTIETSPAAFLHDEFDLGRGRISAALRWEMRTVSPARADSNKAGRIRERRFQGLAAAIAGRWPLTRTLSLEGQVMRSYRPPAIEELFAQGPHLAAYAYEIGNAELAAERGTGSELSAVLQGRAGRVRVTAFRNDVTGYIDAFDTGELEYGPGEEGFLARYQQQGLDAIMHGAEIAAGWRLATGWHLDLGAAWVRGTLKASGQPMPRIPPLGGRLELRREVAGWGAGAILRGKAAQRRLGEFEQATAGYLAADLWIACRLHRGLDRHSLVLRVDNLTDTAYRNHLSRLKSIMPEAGRNLSLTYRAQL